MIRDISINDEVAYNDLGLLINRNFSKANHLINIINNPVMKIRVYEQNDIVIGFIETEELGEETNVTNMVVDPNYRRKHIGDALIKDLINNTKSKRIFLEVNKENYPAINLYKKNGFIEKGIRKGYYDGVDAITMVKEI